MTTSQPIAYASPKPLPTTVAPFDPDEILNLTTYLAVVDKDHNMVSVTSSLLSGFGSGMVVDNGGVFLNHRMRHWNLEPNDVKALPPRKRRRRAVHPPLPPQGGQPVVRVWPARPGTPPPTQLP